MSTPIFILLGMGLVAFYAHSHALTFCAANKGTWVNGNCQFPLMANGQCSYILDMTTQQTNNCSATLPQLMQQAFTVSL